MTPIGAALHRRCNSLSSPREHSVVRQRVHETRCQRHAPYALLVDSQRPSPVNAPSTVVARRHRPTLPSQLLVVVSCRKLVVAWPVAGPSKSSCRSQLRGYGPWPQHPDDELANVLSFGLLEATNMSAGSRKKKGVGSNKKSSSVLPPRRHRSKTNHRL